MLATGLVLARGVVALAGEGGPELDAGLEERAVLADLFVGVTTSLGAAGRHVGGFSRHRGLRLCVAVLVALAAATDPRVGVRRQLLRLTRARPGHNLARRG